MPLYRIQAVALENDAHGYRTAFGASTFARDAPAHDPPGARLAGHRDGARDRPGVGGDADPAPLADPGHDPDRADRRAGRRQRDRLGVHAVAGPGLPQRPAAQAPVVERPRVGTDRHLHDAVDHHPDRARPDGVRLPLRERRPAQRQRRADRGGDGQRVVRHGRVLPRHRAAAAPGAALRRRRRPAARARPVHRAAPARTQRRHQRADDRHLPLGVAEPDRLLGRRRHRLATDRDRALRGRVPAHRPRRPAALRHPRRQVVPRPGPAVEAGRRRADRLWDARRRCCRSAPW